MLSLLMLLASAALLRLAAISARRRRQEKRRALLVRTAQLEHECKMLPHTDPDIIAACSPCRWPALGRRAGR